MPSGRAIFSCITLIVVSALLSISLRKPQEPSPFHSQKSGSLHLPNLGRPFSGRTRSNHAFVTFLSALVDPGGAADPHEDPPPEDEAEKDGYYLSTRMLGYQLLHAPTTGTNTSLEFVVLVTKDVDPYKRARLEADGVTVLIVDPLTSDWIEPDLERWEDVLTKLRVFQLFQYDRICYIDADGLVFGRLDGVFWDKASTPQRTNSSQEALHDHEGPLPSTYSFGGVPDAWTFKHEIPPDNTYLNSGFFCTEPSQDLFDYYMSLAADSANYEKLSKVKFPDQDILNYAHRYDGNMPWGRLGYEWNANWATKKDIDAGVRSAHGKYWLDGPDEDKEVREQWPKVRDEMRIYYKGMDDALGTKLRWSDFHS